MTMVDTFLLWPDPLFFSISLDTTTYDINSPDESGALVCYAPKAGNIRSILWRTGDVPGANEGIVASLQTVDQTTGHPSGTIKGVGNSAYYTTSGTINANTWYGDTYSFVSDYTVAEGEEIAIDIGPADGSGDDFVLASGAPLYQVNNIYGDYFQTSSWTKQTLVPCVLLKYSDGTYASPYTFGAAGTANLTNATTPDEIGNVFTAPFSCTVGGIWFYGDLDGAGAFKLYGTNTRSATVVPARRRSTSANWHMYPFDSGATESLTAGTSYRISYLPSSSTTSVIYHMDYPTNASLASVADTTTFNYTTRKSAGAWTDTTTRCATMGLFITQVGTGA